MNGYCVTVEVLLEGHSPLEERTTDDTIIDRFGELVDVLDWGHPAGGADARGWEVTVTLDADDHETARHEATHAVLAAAAKVSLPTADVVRVEVVREDVRDAELERPNMPDLVSGPEIAQLLGVSRQRVHTLAAENPQFPTPVYKLGVGSLWTRAAIERFAEEWTRKPGRPRRVVEEA